MKSLNKKNLLTTSGILTFSLPLTFLVSCADEPGNPGDELNEEQKAVIDKLKNKIETIIPIAFVDETKSIDDYKYTDLNIDDSLFYFPKEIDGWKISINKNVRAIEIKSQDQAKGEAVIEYNFTFSFSNETKDDWTHVISKDLQVFFPKGKGVVKQNNNDGIIFNDNGWIIEIDKASLDNSLQIAIPDATNSGIEIKHLLDKTSLGSDSSKITTLELGSHVESIGKMAFQGNNIATLDIPDSLIFLDESSFRENKITAINLNASSSNLTKIGSYAFEGNQISSLTISDSVKEIGNDAFANNKLTSLTIPNSVTEIGDNAFANNCFDLLSGIVLPKKFNTHEERERIFGEDYWEDSRPPKTSNKTHATTPLNQEKDKNNKRRK